jgi:hypothetical protein
MKLLHDNLLVREVIEEKTIEGTGLLYKYDDNDPFMVVEVLDVSKELVSEYCKCYSNVNILEANLNVKAYYGIGSHLLIRRINKIPYRDGLFFISFKDVIASLVSEEEEN